MGIGHLGVGLALKRVDPKLNLGLLFFVVLFSDFLLGILVLLGVEQVIIPDNYEELHYLCYVFPYSHGLAATFLWSALIFLLIKLFWPKGKGNSTIVAAILAIAAFSHFLLDLIVHIPEIPLLGQASYKMGLGLWDYLGAALAVEGLLVIGGLTLYLKYTSGSGFAAKYGMILLIGLLLIGQVLGQMFAPAPADVAGIAITLIVQSIIFVGLAFWLDGKRVGRSAWG